MASLTDLHRHVTVTYGYTSNYGKQKKNGTVEILREGLECLRDFCRENNVSLVELFERFDTDNSMTLTLQEFQEGLKVLPIQNYDIYNNVIGLVDYTER